MELGIGSSNGMARFSGHMRSDAATFVQVATLEPQTPEIHIRRVQFVPAIARLAACARKPDRVKPCASA
jgi:hypothetical protein